MFSSASDQGARGPLSRVGPPFEVPAVRLAVRLAVRVAFNPGILTKQPRPPKVKKLDFLLSLVGPCITCKTGLSVVPLRPS
jgi:hypothetical protein